MPKGSNLRNLALKYTCLIVILFGSDYSLQLIRPDIFLSSGISVVDPIYFVRLFVIFYVLVSVRYSLLRFSEISDCLVKRHEEEPELIETYNKTFKNVKTLLGNSKIHVLLLMLGFTLYFALTYSPINPFPLFSWWKSIPAPLINGMWGGAVFMAFFSVLFVLISQMRLRIAVRSVDPSHDDGMGGYQGAVKGFTEILELLILGIGIFFVSFYYLFNVLMITVAVALGMIVLFGVYFFVMYKIHRVLTKAKTSAMEMISRQTEELEEDLRIALKQKDPSHATLSWIALQSFKESSSANRTKDLKTWPLSAPILSRISAAAITSFWLQIAVEQILLHWFP